LPLVVTLVVVTIVTTFTVSLQPSWRQLEAVNPIRQALTDYAARPKRVLTDDKSKLYPREAPIANPPLSDGNTTFSACLLVMDDNPRLAEWLAYHYHVLPLRHVIVASDPRSQTNATFLFNRWRRQGMVVHEWHDADFWKGATPTAPLKALPEHSSLQLKRDRHRGRQKFFYRTCLATLQGTNRTWVTLHDSDEYLVYNHAGGAAFPAWQARQQARHNASALHGATSSRMQPHMVPPTTAEAGQMITYLQHEAAAGLDYYQKPCIGVPRLQFGTAESTAAERNERAPNNVVDPLQLDTLRWRKHALRNDFVKNALGKVILDVSRLPEVHTLPYFTSLHRPIKTICPAPWSNEWESGFRLHHYLGSWEAYSFRDDSRRGGERSREQWEYKATSNAEQTDDVIRPWVQGFVATHGQEQARHLLADAGVPPNYRPPAAQDTSWQLAPDQLEIILATNETVANDNKRIAFDAFVRKRYHQVHADEEKQEAFRRRVRLAKR
jgi:hypothetical protein